MARWRYLYCHLLQFIFFGSCFFFHNPSFVPLIYDICPGFFIFPKYKLSGIYRMQEKIDMFRNRLAKVFRHVGKQAKRLGISCYRVYDHDLPEFPFCIEFYGDKLYVAEYKRRHNMTEEEHDEWMEKSLEVICEILTVTKDNIFLKLRQRKPGRLGQYQKFDEVQHEFVVEENGLKFIVNLSDYLDTGLFLDHRLTRERVRAESKNKKVLNLFAYTGSFSVYAAAGGAAEVVTVDLSKTYLNWAERNFQLNGFSIATSEELEDINLFMRMFCNI